MNRCRLIVIMLCTAAVCGTVTASAAELTVSAVAGLAGYGRSGRWMPVRVDVDNRDNDIAGELIVVWGTAVVQRTVAIAAPSRRSYDFLVRTGDVRDAVIVRLQSGWRELKSIQAPVRVIGSDDNVTLCATGESTGRGCTAVVTLDALPRSWRGYDAADQVLVSETSPLTGDQHNALQLWRAIREVEELGTTPWSGDAVSEDMAPWRRARIVLSVYLAALAIIGFVFRPARRRSHLAVAAVALVVMAGSVVVLASGRLTPVTIRHATVLQQYEGTDEALVTMRGVAEFASDGDYAITPRHKDGAMDVGPAYGSPWPQRFDIDGYPVLEGVFGFGSTVPFQLEVAAPVRVFDVSKGQRTRITNISSRELHGCALPSAFGSRPTETLAPGQSIETTGALEETDPVVRCSFTASPIDFSEATHRVVTAGVTTVVYHLRAQGSSNDSR